MAWYLTTLCGTCNHRDQKNPVHLLMENESLTGDLMKAIDEIVPAEAWTQRDGCDIPAYLHDSSRAWHGI